MRRNPQPDLPARVEARLHGAALGPPLARTLVLAVPAAAVVVLGAPRAWPLGVAGALLLALAAMKALRAVLAWDRTQILVTRDSLVVVHGLMRRRTAAVSLPPGGALEVDQGLVGRLLGFGTVVAGDLEIPYVADPARVCRAGERLDAAAPETRTSSGVRERRRAARAG